MGCGTIQTHTPNPIFSSDVSEWDGLPPGSIMLPPNPSLNDVVTVIGVYASNITVPTDYGSDDILLDVNVTSTSSSIGDTLSTFFGDLDALMATINLTNYVDKALYGVNTILISTVDNTPIPLIVKDNTIVGKLSSTGITDLTAAQVRTLLNTMNVDANCVYVNNTALPLAVGDNTTADKVLLVAREDATFASNPYILWKHGMLGGTDEALMVVSKDSITQLLLAASVKESAYIGAISTSTGADTKNQEIILADQVGNTATRQSWKLRKDGADGRDLKLIKDVGGAETIIIDIDYATGAIIFNNTTAMTGFIDEDSFATNSATLAPSQQSVKAYVNAYAAQQTEVDDIETGAGLANDGSYTPDAGTSYLTAATSLFDADVILDSEILLINNKSTATVKAANKNVQCAYNTYTYSQLPTTGSLSLFGASSIPDNSIITYARVDVLVAFTGDVAATTTIGIGVENTGSGTEDIKSAGAIGTQYTIGLKNEAWSTFKQATPFKLTAARDITVNVALLGGDTTLTAGKLAIYLEYFTTE